MAHFYKISQELQTCCCTWTVSLLSGHCNSYGDFQEGYDGDGDGDGNGDGDGDGDGEGDGDGWGGGGGFRSSIRSSIWFEQSPLVLTETVR